MRDVEEIRVTGCAWVTEIELEWLCNRAARVEALEGALNAALCNAQDWWVKAEKALAASSPG